MREFCENKRNEKGFKMQNLSKAGLGKEQNEKDSFEIEGGTRKKRPAKDQFLQNTTNILYNTIFQIADKCICLLMIACISFPRLINVRCNCLHCFRFFFFFASYLKFYTSTNTNIQTIFVIQSIYIASPFHSALSKTCTFALYSLPTKPNEHSCMLSSLYLCPCQSLLCSLKWVATPISLWLPNK